MKKINTKNTAFGVLKFVLPLFVILFAQDSFATKAYAQGNSPLSEPDMQSVMKWIATRTGALRTPYCWKQSDPRGAGTVPGRVADCPATYTNNGATCGRNADSIGAGSKVADCPAGFTNMGLTCYRGPDTYAKGCTTIFKTFPCKAGYTDNGCFCGRGAVSLGADSMVCPAGYVQSSITKRCIKNCPEGYTNTGETCFRGVSTLGMGSMLCKPAEQKVGARCFPSAGGGCGAGNEQQNGLCYPTCKAGFYGEGPVCWQSCPVQQNFNCGAGCATSQKECGFATASMVIAPIMSAISIGSMLSASEGTATANAGLQTVTNVEKISRLARLKQAYDAVKVAYATIKPAVDVAKTANNVRNVLSSEYAVIDRYKKEFSDSFADMTSPEIEKEINDRFGPQGAYEIKSRWGGIHLAQMFEADSFATAKNVLTVVSIVDITGLTAVVNAFAHPICKDNSLFPAVTPRHKN